MEWLQFYIIQIKYYHQEIPLDGHGLEEKIDIELNLASIFLNLPFLRDLFEIRIIKRQFYGKSMF